MCISFPFFYINSPLKLRHLKTSLPLGEQRGGGRLSVTLAVFHIIARKSLKGNGRVTQCTGLYILACSILK